MEHGPPVSSLTLHEERMGMARTMPHRHQWCCTNVTQVTGTGWGEDIYAWYPFCSRRFRKGETTAWRFSVISVTACS